MKVKDPERVSVFYPVGGIGKFPINSKMSLLMVLVRFRKNEMKNSPFSMETGLSQDTDIRFAISCSLNHLEK